MEKQSSAITVYVNFYPFGQCRYHKSESTARSRANKGRAVAVAIPVTLEVNSNVRTESKAV
jgi:hypothetical protein